MFSIFTTRFQSFPLLAAIFLGQSVESRADTFTIAVIGDQQRPSSNASLYPSFTVQTDWIAANAQANKIRFVTQVGDILEHGGNLVEYGRAEAAMATLDTATNADGGTGIPWNVNYGNHEEDSSQAGSDPAGAWAHNYRDFFGSGSGTHRYAGQPEYGGVSSNDLNTWHIIRSSSAGGAREYLMLNLEYDAPGHVPGSTPDPADIPAFDAIAWAQGIIDTYPGMPTVVTTHVFEGTAFGPPNNPWAPGPGRNSQIQIWDKLVKDNSQIFMVLSGHTSQDTHQVKTNTAGLKVLQMVTDYTKVLPNGGDGFFRLVELDEDVGEIRVKTYTPGVPQNPTPRFDTSANGEFTIALDWSTRFGPPPSGPIMGLPVSSASGDDGATVQCQLGNADATSVTLVWAFDDQGESTAGTWSAAAGGGSHTFGPAVTNDVLSHVISGLAGDTRYHFRFFATDGVDSDWSITASFTTGLGGLAAPSDFTGLPGQIPGGTKVDLSWTDGYAHETGFLVQRSIDPGFGGTPEEFSITADATAFTDATTAAETTYYYRIAAVGTSGPGPFGSNLEVTTGVAGAGPIAGLIGHWKFDDGTGTKAVDSSSSGFDANRSTVAGSWVTGKAGGAYNSPRFNLDATESGTVNFAGTGAVTLSLWLTERTGINFEGIVGFESTGTGSDIYSLKMDNADKINWTVLPSHGPIISTDTLATYAAATGDGWVHVVGVFEQGVGSTLYVNGAVAASTTSAASAIDDKTPPSVFGIGSYQGGSSYAFTGSIDDVQVYHSALSAADVTFLLNNPGIPLLGGGSGPVMGPPSSASPGDDGATLDCQLLNADADAVTLVWASTDQGETDVSTWTGAAGGGSHSFGAAVADDVLSHVVIGLAGDAEYFFRFLATAGGDSDWSAAASFTTGLGASGAPAALNAVAGTTVTTTKVDLTWTDSFAAETGFLIHRSTDSGFAIYDGFPIAADETTYTDDTTAENTTYHYRIAAVGSSGTGTFSAGVEVTTGENPGGGPVAALIGHWTFDEGSGTAAADSSTNGNLATTTADSWTAGVSGSAADQPRYALGDSSDLNMSGTVPVTISLWARTSTSHSFTILAGFEGTGNAGDIYGLKLESGKIRLTGPNLDTPDTLQNYSGGNWVHIVGVNDPSSGNSKIYIDGTEVASGAVGNIPVKTTVQWTMGTYWNSNSYNFNGALDDVQVYAQALSAEEVTFLYNNPGSPLSTGTPDFSDWIDGFGLDPSDKDFGKDPDGDGLANGLEAWFGTHPGEFSAGFADLVTDGTTTTFSHPMNDEVPGDLTGSYQWSLDLIDWYAGDGIDGPAGGPTVTIVPNTVGTNTTVTTTASGALGRMFLRVGVTQN